MDLMSFVFAFVLLMSPPRGGDGVRYIENAIGKFDAIKDYVVDVKVHMDLEAVQAPDMEAKVYYKEPDKVKIDSKGLFFMPKDVGVINPRKFNPDKYEIAVLDTLTYAGDPAVRLSLVPKNDETGNRNITLTIDKKDWLIVEIATAPYPGREASAKITYGLFDGFQMPVKIDVKLDVGKITGGGREFGPEHGRMNQLKGKVEVYYSNYKINSGLSDDIFEQKGED
jgi:outer membrane lipoprotein-sorting protein